MVHCGVKKFWLMLQSRGSSSWAESLTDCVYIYTHTLRSRAYIMLHWMPTHWGAFFILLRTHSLYRDGWLIWCMYQMVGCIHHSPFLAAGNAVLACDDVRTQLECDGRKRVARHSRISFVTLSGAFCWVDLVLSGALLELQCVPDQIIH